jgi:hypothetical protein
MVLKFNWKIPWKKFFKKMVPRDIEDKFMRVDLDGF